MNINPIGLGLLILYLVTVLFIWQSCINKRITLPYLTLSLQYYSTYIRFICIYSTWKWDILKIIWVYQLEFLHFSALMMTWCPKRFVSIATQKYTFWKFALIDLWWPLSWFCILWAFYVHIGHIKGTQEHWNQQYTYTLKSNVFIIFTSL